ncbi:ketoacyl-ACP synthase III [Mucilaginibacter boryungensis]|uniref:Ketoacyl-ACP synthase III n=1 Tax=Mucilaginibacter boryungensis TaxID=768480 RepID=A0ABR9XFP4_9SPHI|nr:ketoacyl-ACP synthase III [Mucilaginibacter boryungensis]MBE9665848.1 ketoacyl-ACP synthase III [Mucilaginibacter boryungensis]
MAFLTFQNVKLDGIASSVPKSKQKVEDCQCLTKTEAEKLSITTGIWERRLANTDICTSDLCLAAAEQLIKDLNWEKSSIDALIFVTQTPDYILPSTAPILQDKLNLNKTCLTLDISLGCSGYVYGLTTLCALVSSGSIMRALLLVGDTITKICSPLDKSTYPLFGDAGSATALSYDKNAKPISANLYSDGSGSESIIVKDGAYRNTITEESIKTKNISEGIQRSANQLMLDGMDVFSFGISKAPHVVKELLGNLNIETKDVDYFIFHQANKMMNDKIKKKLALTDAQVPYCLEKFGNTSCATIPLTISTQLSENLNAQSAKLILCGFGVGLSWGAMYLEVDSLVCSPLIEL